MANPKIDAFRDQYQGAATVAGNALGVSPDVLLSQWGLETGWGKSVIPGTNNLGNIKDFSGGGVPATDNMNGSKDKYRAYNTAEEFAADYVGLIKRKYPAAVGAGNDPTKFASALKLGGYAEDPNYVSSLTNTFNSLTGSTVQAAPEGAQAAPVDPVAYSPAQSFSEGVVGGLVATPEIRQRSFNELPADANANRGATAPKPKLTAYEQTLELQAQGQAARAGYDINGIALVGAGVRANMPEVVTASLNNDATLAKVDSSPIQGLQVLDEATKQAKEAESQAQAVGFWDKARAAYNAGGIGSPVRALMDQLHLSSIPADRVPFNFMSDWESNLAGFDAGEQEYLIANGQGSQQAWTDAQMTLLSRRQLSKKLVGGSKLTTLGAAGFVSMIDPVGLLAFGGVGKVAQMAGVGGAVLASQGRGLAAVAATGVENVVGGMLLDTTMAAAGEHVTMNDFANGMGFNFGFGAGFGLLHLPRAGRAKVDAALQEASQAAARREVALFQQAQENLGDGATPQQIKVEVDRLQVKGMTDALEQTLAPVPESRRILPEDTGAAPNVVDPAVQAAKEERYGTSFVADPAERALFTQYYENAERVLRENTIDHSRHSKLVRAIGLQSTSAALLQSKNPLAQALGVILLESSTGAAQRGQTAALARSMNHTLFLGDFNTVYERSYFLWAREHGGSQLGDYMYGDHYRRFNREVAKLIEDRFYTEGPILPAHPAVEAAANLNFRGLDRMRQAAQKVGTVGAARLGNNSFGYMTRVMDSTAIRALSEPKKKAIVNILADQFEDLSGWDKAFSQEHARRILALHENRALGSVDMPLSIHDERMAGIVADTLKATDLPPERVAELLGKFSRGGANFTKGRTKLSLNTPYNIDGEQFTLMDIVDTDVPKLYRAYAQRMAGEIALTQHGIQGRAGLETLRQALQHGPATHKLTEVEMKAFDQIAAELLGSPFGTRNRMLDAAVLATSNVRLGGMGFTQLGEVFNGIHAVGLARTLATIPAMPRLIREVGQMVRGGEAKNKLLGSLELVGGEIGTEAYRHPIPFAQSDIIAKQAGVETYSRFERILKLGQNIQAKLSFHRAIMSAQVRGFSEQIVGKSFTFIKTGKELDGALKDMGITPEMVASLKADLPNIAVFKGDKLVELDLTKATNPQAAKEYVQAVHRGAAQIIQKTFIGETGKWAHDSFLRMLTQFRGFGIISVEKQYNRQAGVHGAAKALGFMLGAMSFAIPIQLARLHASTIGLSRSKRDEAIERGTDPFTLIRASMNYTSALGLMPDMVEALSVPLGLESTDSARGLSGDIGRIVPAAGLANDVLKAGKGVSSWSPLSSREAANPQEVLKGVMFMGRVPYVIPLVNALGTD